MLGQDPVPVTTGAAAITLGRLSTAASGSFTAPGSGDITLGPIALTAPGRFKASAAGSVTLAGLNVGAAGVLTTPGAAHIALAGFLADLAAINTAEGEAAITLRPVRVAGTAINTAEGAAAVTLAGLGINAKAHLTATGAASVTLAAMGTTAAATFSGVGRASITLGHLGITAAGSFKTTGAASVTLRKLGIVAMGEATGLGQTVYHLYGNGGSGPIDYTTILTTTSGFTWSSGPLGYPGVWKFAVRAYDTLDMLEESNVDAVIVLQLDASGNDVSGLPLAPVGLTGHAKVGGGITLDWHVPRAMVNPTAFHVYGDAGTGTINYGTVLATVPWYSGLLFFTSTISGLTGGTVYKFGVRAANAAGEEKNTNSVSVAALTTCAATIDTLSGTATS
jgi:hypothetical protein